MKSSIVLAFSGVWGSAVRGSAVRGSAVRAGAVRGSAVRAGAVRAGLLAAVAVLALPPALAYAESAVEIRYHEPETAIYLTPGRPLRIIFPYVVKRVIQKESPIGVDLHGNYVVAFAPEKSGDALAAHGELKAFELMDQRRYTLRFLRTDKLTAAHDVVRIVDRASQAVKAPRLQMTGRSRLLPPADSARTP